MLNIVSHKFCHLITFQMYVVLYINENFSLEFNCLVINCPNIAINRLVVLMNSLVLYPCCMIID